MNIKLVAGYKIVTHEGKIVTQKYFEEDHYNTIEHLQTSSIKELFSHIFIAYSDLKEERISPLFEINRNVCEMTINLFKDDLISRVRIISRGDYMPIFRITDNSLLTGSVDSGFSIPDIDKVRYICITYVHKYELNENCEASIISIGDDEKYNVNLLPTECIIDIHLK